GERGWALRPPSLALPSRGEGTGRRAAACLNAGGGAREFLKLLLGRVRGRLGSLFGEAGVAGAGEPGLELLDPAGGVDELQLARIEGMASAANIELQFLADAAGDKTVAATAGNLRFVVVGVDVGFHGDGS